MPYDQSISTAMTHAAEEYGKNHNTKINLITVKGRQSMVNEITSGNVSPDLVVIENQYSLFNLSGLGKLKSQGMVSRSEFLVRSDAVLVVPEGSRIQNISDLTGKRVAVVDMDKYHSPGGCLANFIVADANVSVTYVMESGIPQVYNAVADSSADATCIWKSEFNEQQEKTGNHLSGSVLPDYGMDNYIVLIKDSKDPKEAAAFMDYIVSHKDNFTS